MIRIFNETLRASRKALVKIALALVVLSMAQSLFLLLVGPFMRALFGANETTIPLSELVPAGAVQLLGGLPTGIVISRTTLALGVPLLLVVAGIIKGVATYVYQLAQQVVALDLSAHLREALFKALLAQPYAAISRRSPGAWMTLIMNDVMYLQTRFSDVASTMVRDGVMIIACFIALAFIHPPTALILIIACPFLVVGLGRTGKRISGFAEAWQRELKGMAAAVLDIRSRFPFIRGQGGEERERARFAQMNAAYYRMIRSSILIRSSFAPGLELLGFLVFAGAVYAIGNRLWLKDFGPDRLIQFFAALGVLLRPLRTIGEQLGRMEETRGALAEPRALLKSKGTPAPQTRLGTEPPSPHHAEETITIQEIVCGHDGMAAVSVSNVSIACGRAIAIVGPSGAGKSTLIKTLAGLLAPLKWHASEPWAQIAAQTAFVSQFPFLFDDSLSANLSYGLGKQPSPSEFAAALATVSMSRAVAEMGGLSAHVKAIGTALSGGQIQRLVIARALLAGKHLWLLDEATSALDPQNEAAILTHLIAACHRDSSSLIAVSHRTSVLPNFDEVWLVAGGQLIARGSHASLLENPTYARFVAGEL